MSERLLSKGKKVNGNEQSWAINSISRVIWKEKDFECVSYRNKMKFQTTNETMKTHRQNIKTSQQPQCKKEQMNERTRNN